MNNNKISFYAIVFLDFFNENIISQLLSLNNVNYLSLVYRNNYLYSLGDLVKYLETKKTPYKWKVHSIVRTDIDDGEIIDTIMDITYSSSSTNHLIISKKPKLLNNDAIQKFCDIIENNRYSSDLFGAISTQEPYDLFCTSSSLYIANDKNRDQDIFSKIKALDRKIYEV